LLCHFYDAESKRQKQYYTKGDYAYFNLFSSSSDWLVRGTTDHGITSQREKTSQTPCLNCYQIDNRFYDALEEHCAELNRKYEFGMILSKRGLKDYFGENNIRDIELWDQSKCRPSPDECWLYDIAKKRASLWPFNYCGIVRVKIPASNFYGLPIKGIPKYVIMGILVKEEGYNEKALLKLLRNKDWTDVEVFPLL